MKTARQLRAEERKKRMVTHRASSFEEAEEWDLAYWQSKTPQERLSALQDILEDVEKVEKAKADHLRTVFENAHGKLPNGYQFDREEIHER